MSHHALHCRVACHSYMSALAVNSNPIYWYGPGSGNWYATGTDSARIVVDTGFLVMVQANTRNVVCSNLQITY